MDAITWNENDVLKLAWKNSWNHIKWTSLWLIFCHLKPLRRVVAATLSTLSRKMKMKQGIQNLSNCNDSSQFYEYFGSKFLAGFWHLKPLCGVVAATLSTLSSRLLAFKGCCACDTLVGLQAFRLNEEACRQQFLLLFSAFLVWIWTKMSYNSPSPRTSNSRLYSSSGVGAPLPPQLVTSQRLQNISDSTISISKV